MIYIAGKITGLDHKETAEKFQEMENILHSVGVKVINPMKLGIPFTWPYEQQMKKCFEVIERNATGIFFMHDWSESNGAKKEFLKVQDINSKRKGINNDIKIYYENSNGIQFLISDIVTGHINCKLPTEL